MAGKINWSEIGNSMTNAKKILATGIFLIASLVGGYNILTEHFVTRVYADNLVTQVKSDFKKEMRELKKQSKSNTSMLVEMRMIRLENKVSNGGILTATEQRVYDKLKRQYEAEIE